MISNIRNGYTVLDKYPKMYKTRNLDVLLGNSIHENDGSKVYTPLTSDLNYTLNGWKRLLFVFLILTFGLKRGFRNKKGVILQRK